MTLGIFKHLLCFTYNFSARRAGAVAHVETGAA
jgi:hypothetical protein